MSAATWCGPSSFSTSFIAAKIGRSGQPMQKPGGRGGTCAGVSAGGGGRRRLVRQPVAVGEKLGRVRLRRKPRTLSSITAPVYSPAIGNGSLPKSFVSNAGLVEHRAKGLLDVVRLPLLDDQHRVLVAGEVEELLVDQRIGDVQHVERHVGAAADVGEAEPLQRAHHAVVHAALA